MDCSFYSCKSVLPTVIRIYYLSNDDLTRKVIASIVLFIVTLIALGFVASTISSLVKKAGLSSFDRLLGVVFGVVRGILIVSAVFAVLQILIKLHILSFITYYPWYKDSIFVPHLEVIVEWFFNYLGTSGTGAL